MHKEYYSGYNLIAIVSADSDADREDALVKKAAEIEGSNPPGLILNYKRLVDTDIHGNKKYLGSITYRRRITT